MSKPFLSRLIATLVLLAGTIALPASADPLTPEQTKAVEQVIHDYLLRNPELMIEVLQAAKAKIEKEKEDDSRQAIAAKRNELLADPSSPIGGDPKGDVTIVEFFDYNCPYCKKVEPSIAALLAEDPHIRIVYKEFPILGPASTFAAHVAFAAQKQGKYAAFHNAMMAAKGPITEELVLKVAADSGLNTAKMKADMNSPEIDAILKRNLDLAEALDIHGTPAFIIGSVLTPGATSIEALRQMVADARKSSSG